MTRTHAVLFAATLLLNSGCGDDREPSNTAPTVTITAPQPGESFIEGEPVAFTANGQDAEDGRIQSTGFQWHSDIDGALGQGSPLDLDTLTGGTHRITVTVADSQDATAMDQIQVVVQSRFSILMEWMTGSFSSAAQAATSTDPYHVDVRLMMVRIWNERTDGYWIYVEQAYASSLSSPYRQRIYNVFETEEGWADDIYSLPNASAWTGSWDNLESFDTLSADDLTLRESCGLTFAWVEAENHFHGSTSGEACTASIPDVSYITSESEIAETYLTSWDLGYNDVGAVVMGPYSPYMFDKLENFPIGQ